MIYVCESYAIRHHIVFNSTQSKLLCYNHCTVGQGSLGPIYYFNMQSISIVFHDKHLGNYISTDIHDINISTNVCDLYQQGNSVIADYHSYDSEILNSLHSKFCMHMCGCELWGLTSGYIDKYNCL